MTTSSFSEVKISSELQALLRRWLSFHRVLWALTLISFLIAWNRGLALLYGLFALVLALLLLSYLLPRWQLRHIRVARGDIGELTAGQPGRITYQLETAGARYHIEFSEFLEFADQKEQCFLFEKLAGRSACELQFNCRQRGYFRLGAVRLSSAYPFGIVRITKWIQTEPAHVLVLPRLVDITQIPLPLVADATTLGKVHIAQRGGRDEFTGVREYCHGDELNRIHWPVSARHQNMVVKEYEKLDRPSMLVVLDCSKSFNVGDGSRSTFEYAVTIAASMIRFATRAGIPSYLVTWRDRLQTLSIEAYRDDLYALYDTLARVSCDGRHPYHPIVEQACRRFPQSSLVVTFRKNTDNTLPRLPRHMTHIVLEMDADSFSASEPSTTLSRMRREGNRLIYGVLADSELSDLFQ